MLVQGGTKLTLNIYRGWVGERASATCAAGLRLGQAPEATSSASEAQGVPASMVVAEVEPIGGFVGESISEPLLQAGILLSVLADMIHIDPRMALAALGLFIPQLVFVPLMQPAINRRTKTASSPPPPRHRDDRRSGGRGGESSRDDDRRIERVFPLNVGISASSFR